MTQRKPEGWDDGLAEPVALPRWFAPLICLSVLACFGMAGYALTR